MKTLTTIIAWIFAFVLVQPPLQANTVPAPVPQYVVYGYNPGAGGGGTPPSFVQVWTQGSGNSLTTINNTTAGHEALLVYDIDFSSGDVTAITDTSGPVCNGGSASWTHVATVTASQGSQGENFGAYWCSNLNTTSSNHTISLTSSSTFKGKWFNEISGSSAYDATSCTTANTTTFPTVTTTGADILIVQGVSQSGTPVYSGGGTWTSIASNSYNFDEASAWSQRSTSGSYGVTSSLSASGCIFSAKQ